MSSDSRTIKAPRILMILENCGYPEDSRVRMEAQSLSEAGYHVAVVCPTGELKSYYEKINGVEVYRYPAIPEFGGFVGYVFEFSYSVVVAFLYSCWIGLRSGFDSFHIHSPPDMNSIVPILFRIFGKRFVLDTHDLSPELYDARKSGKGSKAVFKILRWFERLSCRWADRLIATNQSQKDIQIHRGGAKRDHCYVVRNGPNQRFLELTDPLDRFSSDSRTKLGYVGVIGIQDGVDKFIEAMVHLRERRQDFLGIIVGSGDAKPSLENLVVEHELENQVVFTGMVEYESVPRYIASFDIAVTPDPSNAYNDSCTTIKTMEYMALGKPTASFETRENQITAGESALYAKDNDAKQLADCIEQLMDSPELRDQMGAKGKQRIIDSLAWIHQRKQLLSLYQNLFPDFTPNFFEVSNPSDSNHGGNSNSSKPILAK